MGEVVRIKVVDEVYGDKIRVLEGMFTKWIERRLMELGKNVSKSKIEEIAYKIAVQLVLSAEFGAGDAFAGYVLTQLTKSVDVSDVIGNWRKNFEKLGVRNIPEVKGNSYVSLYLFWSKVMKEADFGDDELNNVLRELNKMSASGGRYMPSWLKNSKSS